MYVLISPDEGSSLHDAWNFRTFEARLLEGCKTGLSPQIRAGRFDPDGGYLWVARTWLLDQGPDDAEWRKGVTAMIDYAQAKGWTNQDGAIRAHVVSIT